MLPCGHTEPEFSWCNVCYLNATNIRYWTMWGSSPPMPKIPPPPPKKYESIGKPSSSFRPVVIDGDKLPLEVFRSPCKHEGAILEFSVCNCITQELKHVRDCDLHERCTRGDSKSALKKCSDCQDYTPVDMNLLPQKSITIQTTEPIITVDDTPKECKSIEANVDMSTKEMIELIKCSEPGPWPDKWAWWDNTKKAFLELVNEQLRNTEVYPTERFSGRGVVIAGGGLKYFPGTYVAVRSLRHHGCRLPIEIWYFGDIEIDNMMKKLLYPYSVSFVDAREHEVKYPNRILNGWELKPYAMKHSRFEEVLFMDADNYVLKDPTYLFTEYDYLMFGSIFWPDYDNWMLKPDVWERFGMKHRHEPALESGQMLINKKRCWRELCLANWYGAYSDFVFKHVYGDKECFHLAWRKLGTWYAMPEARPAWRTHTIIQHDFAGKHLFHHRCQDKPRLDGKMRWLDGIDMEKEVKQYLLELREQWDGKMWCNQTPNENETDLIKRLLGRKFIYKRVGHDERAIELSRGGRIGTGAAECERRWEVNEIDGRPILTICREDSPTCHLSEDEDGVWRGAWLSHEKMPVELIPIDKSCSIINKTTTELDLTKLPVRLRKEIAKYVDEKEKPKPVRKPRTKKSSAK